MIVAGAVVREALDDAVVEDRTLVCVVVVAVEGAMLSESSTEPGQCVRLCRRRLVREA